jgi:hypothetical protein
MTLAARFRSPFWLRRTETEVSVTRERGLMI